MASDTQTGAYWIGLSDEAQEGQWTWQNSFSQAAYTNWCCKHPETDVKSNCAKAIIDIDICGNWIDGHCEEETDSGTGWGLHAICETDYVVEQK